jgi:hypothetical protein
MKQIPAPFKIHPDTLKYERMGCVAAQGRLVQQLKLTRASCTSLIECINSTNNRPSRPMQRSSLRQQNAKELVNIDFVFKEIF